MRSIVLLLLTLLPLFAASYDFIIPEAQLQERMKKEFPITHETVLLTFVVSEPRMKLDGVKQRFNFTSVLEIPNIQDSKGKMLNAIVSVSSRIAYSKGGNLYLRNIKVVDIKSSYIASDMKSALYTSLETLLNEYFKTRPVYSLKNEKGLVGEAVKTIENVVIVKEGVKIVFNVG